MSETRLPKDNVVELAGFEAVSEGEEYLHERCGGNSNGSCIHSLVAWIPVTLTDITNESRFRLHS